MEEPDLSCSGGYMILPKVSLTNSRQSIGRTMRQKEAKREFRTYLRLVLMTSVLEPKHYYHRVAYNRILMVSRYFSSTVEAELVDGLERRAAIIAFYL